MARDFRYRRARLYLFYGGRCAHCRVEMTFEESTVDHVIPQALGGAHSLSNLVLACLPCNTRRGSQLTSWMNKAKPGDPVPTHLLAPNVDLPSEATVPNPKAVTPPKGKPRFVPKTPPRPGVTWADEPRLARVLASVIR